MEKTISIVIMLFILSMISERIVTWFKLQFGQLGSKLIFFTDRNEDLTVKSEEPEVEKQREKKILGLNIVLSVLVAICANANFFAILSATEPYLGIGWENYKWHINTLIGWPLTGMFISLGSKFWHDLLDVLLYTKDMKKRLSDPQTYDISALGQLEYLKFTNGELMQLAIAQNEQALKVKYPGIMYLNDTVSFVGKDQKPVVGVYFKDASSKGFPNTLPVRLPSGNYHHVATEVIEGVGKPVTTSGLNGPLRNENLSLEGSACCLLSNDENDFLLTNCHVMTDNQLSNPSNQTGSPAVFYKGDEIGTWEFGHMSPAGDFALVRLGDKNAFVSTHAPMLFSNRQRRVVQKDVQKLKVTTIGGKTNVQSGYIVDIFRDKLAVDYRGANTLTFSEALVVGDQKDRQLCRPLNAQGDSGGLVYDESDNLIGVITAVDAKFSYVIPINKFFEISPIANLQIV